MKPAWLMLGAAMAASLDDAVDTLLVELGHPKGEWPDLLTVQRQAPVEALVFHDEGELAQLGTAVVVYSWKSQVPVDVGLYRQGVFADPADAERVSNVLKQAWERAGKVVLVFAPPDGVDLTRARQEDRRTRARGLAATAWSADDPVAVLTLASNLAPELPDVRNDLAVAQDAAGDVDAARATLEATVADHPGALLVRRNLDRLDAGEAPVATGGESTASAIDEQPRGKAIDIDTLEIDWDADPANIFRGRWAFKPLLSYTWLDRDQSTRLGLEIAHSWFPLGDSAVQVSGENRLSATFPLGGGARGRTVELASLLGPWIGPVGLRAGSVVRYDKTNWDAVTQRDVLAVGPRASVALDIGPIEPWFAVEPAWFVAGERRSADVLLGDEWTWSAGVGIARRPILLNLRGLLRETAAGPVAEIGFGLHIRPFG